MLVQCDDLGPQQAATTIQETVAKHTCNPPPLTSGCTSSCPPGLPQQTATRKKTVT